VIIMQAYVSPDRENVAITVRPDGMFNYRETMCCVDLGTAEIESKPLYTIGDFLKFLEYRALEIPDSLGDLVVRYTEEVFNGEISHADRNLAHRAVLDGAAEIIAMSDA
jgi:hypothetical protein